MVGVSCTWFMQLLPIGLYKSTWLVLYFLSAKRCVTVDYCIVAVNHPTLVLNKSKSIIMHSIILWGIWSTFVTSWKTRCTYSNVGTILLLMWSRMNVQLLCVTVGSLVQYSALCPWCLSSALVVWMNYNYFLAKSCVPPLWMVETYCFFFFIWAFKP